jgi:hypothetical protein
MNKAGVDGASVVLPVKGKERTMPMHQAGTWLAKE